MSIWESLWLALDSVRVNKLRSLLTMIGIVFGVGAVVTVVSIGQAGQQSVMETMSNYKEGYFLVYPDSSDKNNYNNAMFRLSDVKEINKLSNVGHASVSRVHYMSTTNKQKEIQFSITATTADIVKLVNIDLIAGRFFTAQEVNARHKLLVIDEGAAQKIFGSAEQAVQRKLKFPQGTFKVIGVYDVKKSVLDDLYGEQFFGYMPLEAVPVATDNGGGRYEYIEVTASSPAVIEEAVKEVSALMAKLHRVPKDAYGSATAKDSEQMIASTFGIIQLIIGSIAAISLLVGGIGVMNIMLVSVTERTREIGIRKAIGATPNSIRMQFLIESVMLSFIGGVIGIALGLLASFLFSLVTGWPFVVSIAAILIAFLFSSAVGIFFGFYPANKASKLHPIEALRYE